MAKNMQRRFETVGIDSFCTLNNVVLECFECDSILMSLYGLCFCEGEAANNYYLSNLCCLCCYSFSF